MGHVRTDGPLSVTVVMGKLLGVVAMFVGLGAVLGAIGSEATATFAPLLVLGLVVCAGLSSVGGLKRGRRGHNTLFRFPGPTKKLATVVAVFGPYDLAATYAPEIRSGWAGLVGGCVLGIVIVRLGERPTFAVLGWKSARAARWMVLEQALLGVGCAVAAFQFFRPTCSGPSPLSFVRANPDPYIGAAIGLFLILGMLLLILSMGTSLGAPAPAVLGGQVRGNLVASTLLVLDYVIAVSPTGWPVWLSGSIVATALAALALSSVLTFLEPLLAIAATIIWVFLVGTNVTTFLHGGACAGQSVGAMCFLVGGGVVALLAKR